MEIKYRQKYLKNNNLSKDAPNGWDYCDSEHIGGPWATDKDTVTPWTYVTDVEGKDVYLGDIIVASHRNSTEIESFLPILLTPDIKGMRTISAIASTSQVKVVGNMFDNPELAEIALKY